MWTGESEEGHAPASSEILALLPFVCNSTLFAGDLRELKYKDWGTN